MLREGEDGIAVCPANGPRLKRSDVCLRAPHVAHSGRSRDVLLPLLVTSVPTSCSSSCSSSCSLLSLSPCCFCCSCAWALTWGSDRGPFLGVPQWRCCCSGTVICPANGSRSQRSNVCLRAPHVADSGCRREVLLLVAIMCSLASVAEGHPGEGTKRNAM